MYISNAARTRKLLASFATQPRYLRRYVRYHPWRGSRPIDVGLPWWSFGAIDFVRTRLTRNQDAFEFGTGGSTIFLAQHCRKVDCVEDDPVWIELVRLKLAARGIDSVSIQLQPLDPSKTDSVGTTAFLSALDRRYDLIVVDCQDLGGLGSWSQVRPACFQRAEQHINPGGMIVCDDSWRYGELRTQNHAREVRVFETTGPCRMGVTSTDVFMY